MKTAAALTLALLLGVFLIVTTVTAQENVPQIPFDSNPDFLKFPDHRSEEHTSELQSH